MGFHDRRVAIGVASGVVLLLAVLVLTFFLARSRKADAPVVAQRGMLQVQVEKPDSKLDPAKPLRCFVNGQLIGEETLADCAKKNGVAAQALDVGLDKTGQMAAAQTGQASLAPLPVVRPPPSQETVGPPVTPAQMARPSAPAGPFGQCLRFTGSDWREMGAMGLQGCVHTLFEGRCMRPGEALYGRFGPQTLRLVLGRVEISNDNRNFRVLVEQAPDCSLP